MGQTAFLVLLVAAIFALLAAGLQRRLQALLHRRPATLWAAPVLLTAVFTAASWMAGASSLPLTLLVLAYTLAPVTVAFAQGPAVALGADELLRQHQALFSVSSCAAMKALSRRRNCREPRAANSCVSWWLGSPPERPEAKFVTSETATQRRAK